MLIKQNASVKPHKPSQILRVWPTLNPFMIKRLDTHPAITMPGIISNHGTTLNIQLWACGKLSEKNVGNQDSKIKKQLFWQKWQKIQALKWIFVNFLNKTKFISIWKFKKNSAVTFCSIQINGQACLPDAKKM